MYSHTVLVSILVAVAEARFGNEGKLNGLFGALNGFGNPGEAATLGGQVPGVLLGGANACEKLALADKFVADLGNAPEVIAVAKALVNAEKNTNPFAVDRPSFCSDPSLPATAELRGILPLIDPATDNAGLANQLAASSLQTPLAADGLSIADIATANGFTTFTPQAAAAAAGGAAGGANNNANQGNNGGNQGNQGGNQGNQGGNNGGNQGNNNANKGGNNGGCNVPAAGAGNGNNGGNQGGNQGGNNGGNQGGNNGGNQGGNNGGNQGGNNGGNNGNNNANQGNNNAGGAGGKFGTCQPTMSFVPGRANRKPDEFTFLPQDDVVAQGQQDALNPNIITNRICDQLGNVCGASQQGIDDCLAAKAAVEAAGTRDLSTAQLFNGMLGFGNVDATVA